MRLRDMNKDRGRQSEQEAEDRKARQTRQMDGAAMTCSNIQYLQLSHKDEQNVR